MHLTKTFHSFIVLTTSFRPPYIKNQNGSKNSVTTMGRKKIGKKLENNSWETQLVACTVAS